MQIFRNLIILVKKLSEELSTREGHCTDGTGFSHRCSVTRLCSYLLKQWEGKVRGGQECDSSIVDTRESGPIVPSGLVRSAGNVGKMECEEVT